MKRIIRIGIFTTGYFLYFCANIIITLFIVPVAIVTNLFGKREIANHLLHRGFNFFFTKILTSMRVINIQEIKGRENIPTEKAIYICNHRGMLDGPLLISTIDNLVPTMKAKYANKIGYRLMSRYLGFVKLDVSTPRALQVTEEKCTETLRRSNVLIFPEGTRKTANKLSDFKKLAFKLATKCNCPVVPVVIYNDVPFLGKEKGSVFPQKRVDMRISILPALSPENRTPAQLSNRAYNAMSKELRRLVAQ